MIKSSFIFANAFCQFYYSKNNVDSTKLISELKGVSLSISELEINSTDELSYMKVTPHDTTKQPWVLFVYKNDTIVTSNPFIIEGTVINTNIWGKLGIFPIKINFTSSIIENIVDSLAKYCSPSMHICFQFKEHTKYLKKFEIETQLNDLIMVDKTYPFTKGLLDQLKSELGLKPSFPILYVNIINSLYFNNRRSKIYQLFLLSWCYRGFCSRQRPLEK